MQPADGPSLYPHQQVLLADIVAAYEQDHRAFYVMRTLGGTSIQHPAWTSGRIQYVDFVALQRAGMIDAVDTDERGSITAFAPTALAAASVRPSDYLDLSDAAWAVAKGTLGNEPERIRDVQHILSRIDDDDESSEGIKEAARAARILLGQVERYIADGNPTYEPTARVSANSLRALAASILRQTGAYGPLAIELAERVAGLFDT